MPGAQRSNVLLESNQFGLVVFPDLIKRDVNVVQLALQLAECAFVTLISGMRGVTFLFEALNVRLDLSQFIRPLRRLLPGTLVSL